MLALLPRLDNYSPTISKVLVKEIFGYLLRAPLKVDTYNYVPRRITGSFSFIGRLVVTSKSS
jgi:hypothetical protein